MTAKEYIRAYKELDQKILNMKCAIQRIRELADPHSPQLTGMPKATSQVTSVAEQAAVEAVAMEEELADLVPQFEKKRAFLLINIEKIPDEKQRKILSGWVFERKRLPDLAQSLFYTYQYTTRLRRLALQQLDLILSSCGNVP